MDASGRKTHVLDIREIFGKSEDWFLKTGWATANNKALARAMLRQLLLILMLFRTSGNFDDVNIRTETREAPTGFAVKSDLHEEGRRWSKKQQDTETN